MQYDYFSKNNQILPIEQAVVPIDNITFAYGFGVYETIRVDKGTIYFIERHLDRLMESARIIGLKHNFTTDDIDTDIVELIKKNQAKTCNIKILLIGGINEKNANLYIICLNPLFPDRKLYQKGASVITYEAERPFAHAKSLNMLQSYLAYRQAKESGAYDALLVNRRGYITEGTRTNFFVVKDRTIISPPEKEILLGVMRGVVLKVAKESKFNIEYRQISLDDLIDYGSAFLTSTSSKIMPIRSIGSHTFGSVSLPLQELMQKTNEYLVTYSSKLK